MKPSASWLLPCLLALCLYASAQKRYTATDSCFTYISREGHQRSIGLEQCSDSLYIIHHREGTTVLSRWELPYPVYRFDCGDLTDNGTPEIAVGVIKPTRHFPTPDRRLFLFKLYKGIHIRPLWMGSRVARPLLDFRILRDSIPARIFTTERLPDGEPVHGLYRQKGFGLTYEGDLP